MEQVARGLAAEVTSVVERRPPGAEDAFDLSLHFWDGGAPVRGLLTEAGTREHILDLGTSRSSCGRGSTSRS